MRSLADDKHVIVYPNPVKEGETINIQFANKNVSYTIRVFNSLGKLEYISTVNTEERRESYPVLLKQLSAGFYQMEVTSSDGFHQIQKVVIQ